MITPSYSDMLKCPRCRGGRMRISSRSIINAVTHDSCTLDMRCEKCRYDLHARTMSRISIRRDGDDPTAWRGFDIRDIESCAKILVETGKISSHQLRAVSDLVEAVVECVRANTIEAIIGTISSVIDIDITRESTGEFERAFVTTLCIDTEALDRATLGEPVSRPPVASGVMRVSQRTRKAIFDDGRVEAVRPEPRDTASSEPQWQHISVRDPQWPYGRPGGQQIRVWGSRETTPHPSPDEELECHTPHGDAGGEITERVSQGATSAYIRTRYTAPAINMQTYSTPSGRSIMDEYIQREALRLTEQPAQPSTLDAIFGPAFEEAVRRASCDALSRATSAPSPAASRDDTRNSTRRER